MYDFEDDRPLWKRLQDFLLSLLLWLPRLVIRAIEWFEKLVQRTLYGGEALRDSASEMAAPSLPVVRRCIRAVAAGLMWIPRLIFAIVEVLEKALARLFRGKGELPDTVTTVDAISGQYFRWPSEFFIQKLGELGEWANETRIRIRSSRWFQMLASGTYWLWYPPMALYWAISEAVFTRGTFLSIFLSKPFQYLFFWTRWLWYPIVTIIAFLPVWFRSRSRASWIGSIALVAIAMTSVFLFLQFQRPLKLIRKSYQAAIDGALASKNFDLARKYQQKLLTLSSGSQYDVIRRITQLAESGSNAEAIAFAQQLVAQDSAASVDIHFWLAQQFATGKSQLPAAESVATAEYHLQQIDLILEKEIGLGGIPLPALQFLKATIDLQKNDVSAALIQLKDIDDYWPAVALQVELYALSQQPELALRKSVWLYKMAAQDRTLFSELNQDFYLLWSQVLIQGGAEQEFEDVILSWYRKYPEDSRAKLEFSMLQLVQVDRLLRVKVQADLNQASELLLEAVNRVGAEHHQLLSVWFNQRLAPGNTPPRFPELVRMLEESNKTPSYLLEILGTAAFQAGDQSKALNLLTKATELDRNNLVAWNNLSYINSSIPDGNLQLALEAAERIVESEPGNLTFRKTRAQVNMKLKQWERAIEDLKLALAGDPGSTAINANLAVAYQNIGDERLAAWHRQLSEKQ